MNTKNKRKKSPAAKAPKVRDLSAKKDVKGGITNGGTAPPPPPPHI